MTGEAAVTRVDEKYRVALGRVLISSSGLRKGEKLVAVPFKGGLILESTRGRKFSESLRGFVFEEKKHEATTYMRRSAKDADA